MLKALVKQRQSEYVESILRQETRIEWGTLSQNSNITWDIIQQNPDKPWDWFYISINKGLFKLSEAKLMECIRQHAAAKSIARHWKVCNSNPEYLVCRKRLLYEFKNLF